MDEGAEYFKTVWNIVDFLFAWSLLYGNDSGCQWEH